MARLLRRIPDRRTGAIATTTRRCGRASSTFPTRSSGRARQALRNYLFAFIRERARAALDAKSTSARARVVAAGTLLDPNALTIGFARRFTGYKRPELIFHDPDRLLGILNASRRPVQIVFAGKAHPADETGKHHLQQVYRRAIDPMFGGRIAFVDDYDLHVAHFLVQGCDVWLNNPRKPLEASGTSGMKASHQRRAAPVSIGDGWWAEGYTGDNGWLIDGRPQSTDHDAVDAADAEALYQLLEREIVPTFYDRDAQGIPRRWLPFVRQAIVSVAPRFSARRMVKQYAESCTRRARPQAAAGERTLNTVDDVARGLRRRVAERPSTDRRHVPQNRRPGSLRAVRREGSLRAARRRDATAATAGTRRSRSKRSSRASSR